MSSTPPKAAGAARRGDRGARLADTLRRLHDDGFGEVEVYTKRGRSRRIQAGPEGASTGFHREAGWAVRASGPRASFAASGTGDPDPAGPWPEPDGEPFRLPDPAAAPPFDAPEDLDTPLVGEVEGLRLIDGLARELETELPGARLIEAVLEDGASEQALVSSRGVGARWRNRLAALRAKAVLPARGERAGSPPATASFYLAEREARRFNPKALARRLADRLAVAAADTAGVARDRAEMLLDPVVAAQLLTGLRPLLVGPQAIEIAEALRDRGGRFASLHLTLTDDGRLPGGALSAPCDGEGVPTRPVTLIDGGAYRQPLLAWHQMRRPQLRSSAAVSSGCSRRPGWRDLPQPGPTHLYIQPSAQVSVGSLIAEISRGYYLLDTAGGAAFDFGADRFRIPVRGFAVESGRAVAPLPRAVLSGGIGALLRGIQAAARDLTFLPFGGMIGSPSLLVTGLELTAE